MTKITGIKEITITISGEYIGELKHTARSFCESSIETLKKLNNAGESLFENKMKELLSGLGHVIQISTSPNDYLRHIETSEKLFNYGMEVFQQLDDFPSDVATIISENEQREFQILRLSFDNAVSDSRALFKRLQEKEKADNEKIASECAIDTKQTPGADTVQ